MLEITCHSSNILLFPDKSDEILKRIVKVLGSSQKQQTVTLPNQESENGSNQNANTSGEDTSSGVEEQILNTSEETISQHSDIISNVTGTSDQHTPDLDTVDSLIDADSNTSCSMNLSSVENEDTLMTELKVCLIFCTFPTNTLTLCGSAGAQW